MDEIGTGVRVLHVDDDEGLLETVADYLGHAHGFEVETATGAEEARSVLASTPVDCVVSDYDMPDTDGVAFLRAVREDHPDLPFVLFTGAGSEEIASEAISAGVDDYLRKAYGTDRFDALARRVGTLVARARAESSYREIFEKSGVGLTVRDPETGAFVDANERYCELMGYTREEVLSLDQADVTAGEAPFTSERGLELVRDAAENGPRTVEWRNQRRDGGTFWAEVTLRPATIRGQERVLVSVRDVTDREERERDLEETNALLTTLLENLPVGILAEDDDREVIAANPALADLFGVPPAEADIVGRDCGLLAEELKPLVADPDGFLDGIDAVLDRRERVENEQLALADGRILERSYVPLDFPDGGEGNLWLYRDATARRRRERDLERQNERLEEFASIVSHDLRNPLSVAQGFLDLVREESDDERLDRVASAHDRMEALIEDLLALAQHGRAVDDPESVRLSAVLADAAETTAGDATVTVAGDRTLLADPGRLQQLFENLLRNAVEHGSTGSQDDPGDGVSSVTVEVGAIDGTGFYVEDDGPGIPEAERDRVFEYGYSTGGGGTGFGLAIVRRIADAHGWEVTVTRGERGGARFEFRGVTAVGDDDPAVSGEGGGDDWQGTA